jgi:hypothetical protein
MKTIYKYPISTDNYMTSWYAPAESKSIYTAIDPNGVPCIWMEVTVDAPNDTRYYAVVVGTGYEVPSSEYAYLGSFMEMGTFIWHIYVTH